MTALAVRPVTSRADRKAFVELAYELNRGDPNWVPPLRNEVYGLIDPGENPWFDHAEAAFFLARRNGRAVGRISAQVDALVLEHMGAGTGQWGMIEAADEAAAHALIAAAEDWLKAKGMSRALGPFSLSIWDEPGLLVEGHDHAPTVMMGHHNPAYEKWIEAAGYRGVKDLYTYELDAAKPFPPLIRRIVASGEKNPRIRIRTAVMKRFDEEAAIILGILNDAWSGNWGYIPLTDAEIAYAGKKLKPIVREDLVLIAEYDAAGDGGFEPVAFMMALLDVNEYLRDLGGSLFPFGWAKLLWRLRRMRVTGGRVPLMGVVRRLHASRLASQLAFMMIDRIRVTGAERYGVKRGEVGWVLDDNEPMKAIAAAVEAGINRVYRIYEKSL
jgi:hypothetical protein